MSWKRTNHPPEVLEVIDSKIPVGTNLRILHKYKETGEPCSVNKDSCMIVSRKNRWWFYYCHRCHEKGRIPLDALTPHQTQRLLEHTMKATDKEVVKVQTSGIRLPKDVTTITSINVPTNAINWLQKYGIGDELCKKYGILWSSWYKRIIFPIYNEKQDDIIGWLGRCPEEGLSKEERQKNGRPKWLIRKDKNYNERLYFHLSEPNDLNTLVIFVEDAVSAIKVYETIGCPTIALLNTNLSYDVVSSFDDRQQVVWLDSDVFNTTLEHVKKYTSFGFKVFAIHSQKDPKELSETKIREKLEKSLGAHIFNAKKTGKVA